MAPKTSNSCRSSRIDKYWLDDDSPASIVLVALTFISMLFWYGEERRMTSHSASCARSDSQFSDRSRLKIKMNAAIPNPNPNPNPESACSRMSPSKSISGPKSL